MVDTPLVTTISKDKECVTLVNTFFTSGPQEQDQLVKILTDLAEEAMKHQAGFISSNIHRSYDGSTVMSYVQWRSTEHWRAAFQKPEAQKHVKHLIERYKREVAWYQVIHISQAADSIPNSPVSKDMCDFKSG